MAISEDTWGTAGVALWRGVRALVTDNITQVKNEMRPWGLPTEGPYIDVRFSSRELNFGGLEGRGPKYESKN